MACRTKYFGTFPGNYANEKTPRNDGSTGVFSASTNETKVSCVPDSFVSLWQIFQRSVEHHSQKPFLGWRPREHGRMGPFKFSSYEEVDSIARVLGSNLMRKGLCPLRQFPDEEYAACREMRTLGIFCKNCPAWLTTEQACFAFNIVTVPLYDTLGASNIHHIVRNTELATVVISSECIPQLVKMVKDNDNRDIKHLILVDDLNAESWSELSALGIDVLKFDSLITGGTKDLEPSPATSREAPATICYTSGTTNLPKGVILTHGNILATVAGAVDVIFNPAVSPLSGISHSDVHLSYLPLAHMFERLVSTAMWTVGATICCYSGDQLKLLDDIAACEPTFMCAVPRVFSRIYDKLLAGLQQKSYVAQTLFSAGSWWKLRKLRQSKAFSHLMLDKIVFAKVKNLLGSRLRFMICGGAPLSPELQEMMQILFSCPVIQGYGMSETCGPAFTTHPLDPAVGTVGGPIAHLQFKIVSVPEMEYFADDATVPKGELCMRGATIFPGYFRNPEETDQQIDSDGWLHSGDIVELRRNGSVKIVDRKKNIFKLAQGEYVSPERVENVYTLSGAVAQCFVFGNSYESYCVAIVVPSEEASKTWATANKKNDCDLLQLCKDEQFRLFIANEMEAAAKSSGLRGFEKAHKITLVPDMFTVDNGLLTPTLKLIRHTAAKTFKSEISFMYGN